VLHLIGCKTINIPEIFSGVHGFTEKKTVNKWLGQPHLGVASCIMVAN